jgi:hypothetical protein
LNRSLNKWIINVKLKIRCNEMEKKMNLKKKKKKPFATLWVHGMEAILNKFINMGPKLM